LSKTYPNGYTAVQPLYFGIPAGQCFGFLGVNGAGKTTTLKMLSMDHVPSEGSATLNGFDLLTEQAEVRRSMG
jgi:ATP-binding cassette subfamily A (ABC1) protein 1